MTLKTLQPEAFYWTWFRYVSLALHDLYQYVLQVAIFMGCSQRNSWGVDSKGGGLCWQPATLANRTVLPPATRLAYDPPERATRPATYMNFAPECRHRIAMDGTNSSIPSAISPDRGPSHPSRSNGVIGDKLQDTVMVHYKRMQQMAVVQTSPNIKVIKSISQTSTPSAALILQLHYALRVWISMAAPVRLWARRYGGLWPSLTVQPLCWSKYISRVELTGGTQRNLAALRSVAKEMQRRLIWSVRCKVNQVGELNVESSDGFHWPIVPPPFLDPKGSWAH